MGYTQSKIQIKGQAFPHFDNLDLAKEFAAQSHSDTNNIHTSPKSKGLFGNMINFHNTISYYCNPAPSVAPIILPVPEVQDPEMIAADPRSLQRTTETICPLYPRLDNEFSTYGHPDKVEFPSPSISEACVRNQTSFYEEPLTRQPTTERLYPNLAAEFSTFGLHYMDYTVDFRSTQASEAYLGNTTPNFHNVHNYYYKPLPSAPPAPPDFLYSMVPSASSAPQTINEKLGAEITRDDLSLTNQDGGMQSRGIELKSSQGQTSSKKRNKKKKKNNDLNKKPCPNAGDGCILHFNAEQMRIHVKECIFLDIVCPLSKILNCVWKGKLQQIKNHFCDAHQTNIGQETQEKLLNSSRIIHLVDLGPTNKFLVHINVDEARKKILAAVQQYSTKLHTSKWNYGFEFHGPMMAKKKLEGTCIPASISIEDNFEKLQCIILEMSPCVRNAFLNGTLTYEYHLIRVYEEH